MLQKNKENEFLRAPEYAHVSRIRLITILIIGLFVAALGGIAYFSYQLIYATIGKIEYVNELKSSLYFETIDFNRLEKVRKMWGDKQTTSTLPIIKDPFFNIATSTPALPAVNKATKASI